MQALTGTKIMDLSMNLPGPYMTWLLAALGAEILKIENPQAGDPTRAIESDPIHPFPLFGLVNSNKKSMTLNLKHAAAKKIFIKLLSKYDILVEGFRPGVMEKLGLGYDILRKIQPRIIYVSISGFGQSGPSRLKAAHDLNYQAITGCFHAALISGGIPQVPSIPIADLAGGSLFGLFGLLAAVIQRERTGVGQQVDISLSDGAFSMNILGLCHSLALKKNPGKADNFLCGTQPFYNIYQTVDDRYITLGAVEFKFWKNFCITVERKDLISRQFGGAPVIEIVSKIFRTRPLSDWSQIFENVDACVEPILSIEEAMTSSTRFQATSMQNEIGDSSSLLPFRLPGSPLKEYSPAPELGQHNVQTLAGIGFSNKNIKDLKTQGAI